MNIFFSFLEEVIEHFLSDSAATEIFIVMKHLVQRNHGESQAEYIARGRVSN